MKKHLAVYLILFSALLFSGCNSDSGDGGNSGTQNTDGPIVVTSLADFAVPASADAAPGARTGTLRSALAMAEDGQPIVFDPSLDGGTIALTIIGEDHSILKGEVMGMRQEPSGPVSYLVGYYERDYGKSALYARKNVVLDASALPSGITLAWTGGEGNPARVLAVYGDLTMINVSVTGGWSEAETLPDNTEVDGYEQLSTRARGGAIAVWGKASLSGCKLYNNHCLRPDGVPSRSRDAGVFGGGVYADIVDITNSIISGNSVTASGVSGGGVFSVGGADSVETTSTIKQSSITGNHITGSMAYGGGVYSDGGGIGKRNTLELINSTIARNIVDYSSPASSRGYWRGGGFYMSNGYLYMHSCTVVENEVHGRPRTDSLGRPNLAGGIAATIGNAHAVEDMTIGHSIVAGNTVHELGGSSYDQDIFTGSLLYFKSMGYNRFGTIEFSHILIPVGETDWKSLCRKHYPKAGDQDGVDVADVLNLTDGITYSDSIRSVGVDAPNFTVLHYEPQGNALDQVPVSPYSVDEIFAEYSIESGGTNDFLAILLDRIEDEYTLANFAGIFTTDFETFLQAVDLDDAIEGNQTYTDPDGIPILTLADTQWFGPAVTWPKELHNYPYIEFWHRLDTALSAESIPGMGPELLGDDAWTSLFSSGALIENEDIIMSMTTSPLLVVSQGADQLGTQRPANTSCDIGAIEIP